MWARSANARLIMKMATLVFFLGRDSGVSHADRSIVDRFWCHRLHLMCLQSTQSAMALSRSPGMKTSR